MSRSAINTGHKRPMSITLAPEVIAMLERMARRRHASKSHVLEELVRDAHTKETRK